MNKKIKIYTKTGDNGATYLIGGSRVKKYDLRLESYGTVDELNAWIGMIRSSKLPANIAGYLTEVQNKLFNIGSLLASDEKGDTFTMPLPITEENIRFLENAIDEMEDGLPEITHFIILGGDLLVSYCNVARTVCRRAERRIVELSELKKVQPEIVKYINRLSDFLFVLARRLNHNSGTEEIFWTKD